MKLYSLFFKRLLDVILSFIVLGLTFPIILFSAIVLYFQNEGSVFFYQERPGKNQKPFKIIKFKTMNDKRNAAGDLLPDNLRITTIGKWIRKMSIDELPQLINVIKGDMSLIGPRPLLFKYMPLYNANELRRHLVRPGITGWAQVNGRNAIPWKKKFELDVFYVDNISLLLDLKIVVLTILKIVKSEGINQSSNSPMEPFNGKN